MEKEIIIIPDVHGRSAWRKAEQYAGKSDCKIVFLGDYHDPYPNEGILPDESLKNFKEIVEFRKSADNIVTLLGNHDLGYLFKDICSSRRDYANGKEIATIFSENDSLFNLIYEEEQSGRKYSFSHSYVHKTWLELAVLDRASESEIREHGIVEFINGLYHTKDGHFIENLGDVSFYRGGFGSFGSMVWSDVREAIDPAESWINPLNMDKPSLDGYYQIFGHTMLSRTYIDNGFACLDVPGKIFKLSNGEITELS